MSVELTSLFQFTGSHLLPSCKEHSKRAAAPLYYRPWTGPPACWDIPFGPPVIELVVGQQASPQQAPPQQAPPPPEPPLPPPPQPVPPPAEPQAAQADAGSESAQSTPQVFDIDVDAVQSTPPQVFDIREDAVESASRVETMLEEVLERLERMEKLIKRKHHEKKSKKWQSEAAQHPTQLPALTRSRSLSVPRFNGRFD